MAGELVAWGRCMMKPHGHQNMVQHWGVVPVRAHRLCPRSRKVVRVAMGISQVSEAFGPKRRHLWAPKKPVALHHSFVLHVVEVTTPSTHTLVSVCVSLF